MRAFLILLLLELALSLLSYHILMIVVMMMIIIIIIIIMSIVAPFVVPCIFLIGLAYPDDPHRGKGLGILGGLLLVFLPLVEVYSC